MSIYNFSVANNVACMDFNPSDPKYGIELVNASFNREVKYLTSMESASWCPNDVNIDYASRKIYFEYGINCEEYLPSDWKEKLETILKDFHKWKIYKPSIYPKYFFIDKNKTMKAFNFYTAFDYSESPLTVDTYRAILNPDRAQLIDSLSTDGRLDLKLLMFHAFNNYVSWQGSNLQLMYKNIYE